MFPVWGLSAGSALRVAPHATVCKRQHLAVHGRLVNTPSCMGRGSLTSGKTFSLKYRLSSSSMSAPGLQDNICSLACPRDMATGARSTLARRADASSRGCRLPFAASFPSLLLCSLPLNSEAADGRKITVAVAS